MKLYDFPIAPNPQRVNMFLAEKKVQIPRIEINTRQKEQFTDDYKSVNSICQVPTLELDDGTCITESMAICRYIEELHPEPVLFGESSIDRALIEMWSRRAEFMGYLPAADVLRNSSPIFKDRGVPGVPDGVPQISDLAERGRGSLRRFYDHFEIRCGISEYIAGNNFSVADITTFIAIRFATQIGVEVPDRCTNLHRWFEKTASRPSAN